MKRVYLIQLRTWFAIALMISSASLGQAEIVVFDLSSQPGGQESTLPFVAPHIIATSLTRGPGLSGAPGMGSINASGFTTLPSIDLSDYFQFTVSAAPGYALDLQQFVFGERRSLSGVRELDVRTSLDQFATFSSQYSALLPDNDRQRNHTITLTGLSNVTGVLDVRIYGFASESSAGTWRITNHSELGGVVLSGTVTAVPEPSSMLLLGSAFVGGLWFRNRRIQIQQRGEKTF